MSATAPTVVIVGAGGLGAPLALALGLGARAGRLVLVDDDVVDLSNLPRQILFGTADVGRAKVDAARAALVARGVPAAHIEAVRARFDAHSAAALLHDADVVCDGSDDAATKFLVNDAARARGVPAVIAGVVRDRGNVFPVRAEGGPCYRCLFESPPGAGSDSSDAAPTCADAGVLGPRCGQVAAHAARVATALVAERGAAASPAPDSLLTRRVWIFDDGAEAPRGIELRARRDCPTCLEVAS